MQEPTHSIAGSRALTVLVAGASTIVLIVGLQYFAGIIGPLFLALVLTIAVQPLREAVIRRGVPRWVGSVVAMICLFAGLLALSFAIVAAGAQLVNLLGDFGPQFGNLRDQLADTMRLAGMDASRAKAGTRGSPGAYPSSGSAARGGAARPGLRSQAVSGLSKQRALRHTSMIEGVEHVNSSPCRLPPTDC